MQSSRPREIRKFIEQQFAEIQPDVNRIDHETLLIRNGQYCGHRYQSDGLSAVWFLEENQIKLFDESGHLLRVVCPSDLVRATKNEAA